MSLPLLADATSWATDHLIPIIGAVVVVVGLFVFGRTDLARFSWTRVWAISGVCFSESIRRKVLWLIPLAIVGLVAVVQLQQPSDEQDAIRQTTKFCLLASGLVVVLTTLILACTNLPREIENRVIFTVVTKPTTRLEIVLGKVVGFARVSFTILLVMGLFTWGYLTVRSRLLTGDLKQRLAAANAVDVGARPTLQHYADQGLLNAKSLADPVVMNVYGRPPQPGSHRRYLNTEGYLLVPVALPPNLVAYADPKGEHYTGPGMQVQIRMGYDPAPAPPATRPGHTPPAQPTGKPPQINVQVFDPNVNSLVSGQQAMPNGPVTVASADGKALTVSKIPAGAMPLLQPWPFVFVAISVASGTEPLWVDDDPAAPPILSYVAVIGEPTARELRPVDPTDPTKPGDLVFTGREGTFGQQVRGAPGGGDETCVYRFRHVKLGSAAQAGGQVGIEMRVGVEKNGDVASEDVLTDVRLSVTDPATHKSAELPGTLHPENNRVLYASLPADLCASGDFDVGVRCYSGEQWVGLKPTSLSVVQADGNFGLNLAKSLTVLWLLSVLVTTISVFCSTFLTWPTAVVLTLVLLFGRWALNELGDAASAGQGRTFAQDMGVTNTAELTTIAKSVDTLTSTFRAVGTVLPDISAFSATDDIDRGLIVPGRTLLAATLTLLGFGLPLTVAAYVILKHKEVAP